MANQSRLPTLLLIFILCFSPWPTSGETVPSHFGASCADECPSKHYTSTYDVLCADSCEQRRNHSYGCNTPYGWDYCSPRDNVDHEGNACHKDYPCDKYGEGYYRCRLENGNWRRCARVEPGAMIHQTKRLKDCIDDCQYYESGNYFWCHTQGGWGYCSPRPDVTYRGVSCRPNHKCGTHGYSYNWCYTTDNNNWNYCGATHVGLRAMIHQTKLLKDCTDDCQYYESGNYFWCHTQGGWDYCSPRPDVTYTGVSCRPGHKCGDYGYSYNWCYTTDNNNWDYCGATSPGGCVCSPPHHSKWAPNDRKPIRTVMNNGRQINFFAEPVSGGFAQTNSKLLREALHLINQWDNQGLGNQAKSNLIRSDDFRIDLQGTIPMNNQHYYNLRVQLNGQREKGRSTTVSQIIVPPDTSAANMRQAFIESLNREARIVLEPAV